MLVRSLLGVAIPTILLNAGIGGGPKADDAKNVQGNWKIVSVDGPDKIPADALKKLSLKITADKLAIQSEGKELNTATFKLNAAKKPGEIDIVVRALIYRGDVVAASDEPRQGIYELKGDDLKICIAFATSKKTPNPAARPTEFKAAGDLTVLTLKRDK